MVNRNTILALIAAAAISAQPRQEPGKSIGSVSTRNNLIVVTLDEGALGKTNLFDLEGRTLRFTPDSGGYRVSNLPIAWDPDHGSEMPGPQANLRNLKFPFSGKTWDSFSVGIAGSIRFGEDRSGQGGRGGGVSIGRFDQLQQAARALINTSPAICVFLKPRMSGHRYIKELADRVVITWDVTEPYGGIQDFTWTPTVNRFQSVLHADGAIEMSYQQVAARDAVVGVYPALSADEKPLDTITRDETTEAASGAVRSVSLSALGGILLKVTIDRKETNADSSIRLNARPSTRGHKPDAIWTIRRGGRGSSSGYFGSGPGVLPPVEAKGGTISVQGTLPAAFNSVDEFAISVESDGVTEIAPHTVKRAGIRSPEVDFSSIQSSDAPLPAMYESFHYYDLPNPRDLTCSVIKALGDNFDFLAYYSDFRVDNQEAGTPSNGPRGGNVTGIGSTQRGLESFCSAGRFQWQFIQPVYAGSNQMQKGPPEGVSSTVPRDIAYYRKQIGEISTDGKMPDYNYALSQIAHEMGHRWSAFVSAKIRDERIQLGPTHWARGLQAPVAFPFQRPYEASIMGGGVWQDNFDGTFTQLDDDYYVPATSWSYLDLYLMGLITAAEVPDFFILRNLVPAGQDANGHPKFKADRTKINIQDVIATEGARLPAVEKSQRAFNTGMVAVIQHGTKPSRELLDRMSDIRSKWIEYWSISTGHRSSMTADLPSASASRRRKAGANLR